MLRKILVVDDHHSNRLSLVNTLRGDYEVMEAENGREALAVVRRMYNVLSAVLLEIVIPELDGYEVLRRLREDPLLAQLPVIMVTDSGDEESRVKALTLGANDFIHKPFNPEIVRHCLKNNITLHETASLLNAIRRDKLTGLYNREAFFDKVTAAIREKEPGYYILSCFDIDNFKLVNERLGVAECDRILREIGRVVKEDMKSVGGIGGRISADNFAALLPLTEQSMSITRILRQDGLALSDRREIVFSVGRYVVTDLSLPASALYDRAYIAKRSVKGRYDEHTAYFSDTMLEKLVRGQQIIIEMDTAVAERQFEVWFQPQFNHISGALIGAEALARWRHPVKGLISPGEFIPLFEQNGFIYELDKYVWEETCRCLREMKDGGCDPMPVSVNISRCDLFKPDLVSVLTGLLGRYGIPVYLLRLEITESAFAKSTKTVVQTVKQLIERGFTVEIDDFGKGYSSLMALKNVPAQIVKLDMSFLEDDDGSGRGENILESVVRMTKWLGMSVIAEGVEDKAQADYLASVGCNYIQGYLYARPMPKSDYEDYCRNFGRKERLLTKEAVANPDKNAFWDFKSLDTLLFNHYVGAACIFEYHDRRVELLRVNTKCMAILGDGAMSVEDALRFDWLGCLTPESRKLVRGALHMSAESGEEHTDEYVFADIPGGPPKTYLRMTMRVIATTGKRRLVYCACENITAQRQAEETARSVSARLRTVMESVDVGVVAHTLTDGAMRFLFANSRFYTMRGYRKEQYDAEVPDAYGVVASADRARVVAETERIKREGESALVYNIVRRDGSERVVRSTISTCRFDDVAEPVQLTVFRDITEDKQFERREHRGNERLQAALCDMDSGVAAIADRDMPFSAAVSVFDA